MLTWCGLTTAAGDAQAAPGDGHQLVDVRSQSLDRLVGDVDTITTDLTEIARVPDGTSATDAPAAAPEPTQPAEDEHRAAQDSLGSGIDQLTELATSLDHIGASVRDGNGGTSTPPRATEGGGVDEPVGVQAPGDVAAVPGAALGDVTTVDASAQDPSAEPDGPSQRASSEQHERTAHAATSAASIYPPAGTFAGGGGGNTPVQPMDPRAFTSSTTSGSSAGSTAFDGGSGARVVACQLPYAAQSATTPSQADVEVLRNAAGQPRVSPD